MTELLHPCSHSRAPGAYAPGPEEVDRLRPYEIAVIFDAEAEENVIRETIDRVHTIVRDGGGTPGRVDRWGRRPFAYEVKHKTEGYYVFVEVVAEPDAVLEVDRNLTLADAVVRHRVIRQPEHVAGRARPAPAPAHVQAPTPAAAAAAAAEAAEAPVAEAPAEEAPVVEATPEPVVEATPEPVVEATAEPEESGADSAG
jgi:small subunit ribosomal protein S6